MSASEAAVPASAKAPSTFRLEIVSLGSAVWSGEVRQAALPGWEGRLGILPRHSPLLTRLREGMVDVQPLEGEPLTIYVSGGYVEVQPYAVTVLADAAVRSADLDLARAESARNLSSDAHAFGSIDVAAAHAEMMESFGEMARNRRRTR